MSSLFNVFVYIGLIAASLRNVRALPKEDILAIKSVIRYFVNDCIKDFSVDTDEFIQAKESGMIDSLDPCIFACFEKKVGLINDKGEIDREKSTKFFKMLISDEESQKKATEVIEICSSINEQLVSDDEGCERAVLLFKCLAPFKDQMYDNQMFLKETAAKVFNDAEKLKLIEDYLYSCSHNIAEMGFILAAYCFLLKFIKKLPRGAAVASDLETAESF